MSVDAATVRRIAHLARIAVADDEVEHLQGELNAMLAFVEQLHEVDVDGVEPMTSVTPMAMKKRHDVVTDGGIADDRARMRRHPRIIFSSSPRWWSRCAWRAGGALMISRWSDQPSSSSRRGWPQARRVREAMRRRFAGECPPARRRKPTRSRLPDEPTEGRMTELTSLTLAEARDGLRRRDFSAAELTDAHLAAIEKARALNAYVLETPDKARAMAKAVRRAARATARRGRSKAFRSASRICSAPRACAPRRARTSSTISCRPMNRPSPRNLWRDGAVMLGKLNKDEFAMGSSNETSHFGPVTSPWRRKGVEHAAGAGRLVGRLGVGGGGAVCASARPAPTPAARSASRRPSPAPSASSRPMAAARAGASSPSPPRSIRPGRSRAPCAMPRSCCARWPGTIPKDTTSRRSAGAGLRSRGRPIGQGHAHRHSEGIPRRRHAGRDRDAVGAGRASG